MPELVPDTSAVLGAMAVGREGGRARWWKRRKNPEQRDSRGRGGKREKADVGGRGGSRDKAMGTSGQQRGHPAKCRCGQAAQGPRSAMLGRASALFRELDGTPRTSYPRRRPDSTPAAAAAIALHWQLRLALR